MLACLVAEELPFKELKPCGLMSDIAVDSPPLGWFRNLVAVIGAKVIYLFIWSFGRTLSFLESPWLSGPLGTKYIGDAPYAQCAEQEGLTVTRNAETGGLIETFADMNGPNFNASDIDPAVVHFYENTAEYRMDVWSNSYFPGSLGLWLLVTTISRKVNQLNFPVNALETAKGMISEIVLLKDSEKRLKYTGWFRKMADTGNVIYTGFYMLVTVPNYPSKCVKVVFPMPDGNATVILRPEVGKEGSLILTSEGNGFGDVGFYRIQRLGKLRVWRIGSLKENFRVYVDKEGVLRCDHTVDYLGLKILSLHYRIELKKR